MEVVEEDTTQKTAKNSVTNTTNGVTTIVKVITFRSFDWRKCFSPRKVHWRVETTFFTGNCIVASRRKLWSERKDDPEVRIELNVEPDVFALVLGQVTKSFLQP